jgi:hypothetical protein
MELNSTVSQGYENEISLIDLIKKGKELFAFFKRQFWKITFFSIIGSALGFGYAYRDTPIHIAKMRFLMKNEGGGSALMSSLGSLGSLIGGASTLGSPLERTIEIIGSDRIVGYALLRSINVNGKNDLAINHFINIQDLKQIWKEDTILNRVIFKKNDINIQSFNFAQRKAFKNIVTTLAGQGATIVGKSFDKKSGVFTLTVSHKSEEFSIEFAKAIFEQLEQFIYSQSVNTSGKNVVLINNKLDSIKAELNYVQNSLARSNDRTLGLLMQEDKVNQKKLMIKEQMLTMMYGEAQKNLETFKFMNESINSGLEVIEQPYAPIKPVKKSTLKFALIGFLFFGFSSFSFLVAKNWLTKHIANI